MRIVCVYIYIYISLSIYIYIYIHIYLSIYLSILAQAERQERGYEELPPEARRPSQAPYDYYSF